LLRRFEKMSQHQNDEDNHQPLTPQQIPPQQIEQQQKKKRLKRIPIADLEFLSFQNDRSIQGTVETCERQQTESLRSFRLKDITVSPASSVAAAGLQPRETEERFNKQAQKRGISKQPIVHTITVILIGEYSHIDISQGDLVWIAGKGVEPQVNVNKQADDHHLEIVLRNPGCVVEVVSTIRGRDRQNPQYEPAAVTYQLDKDGFLNSSASSTRHPSNSIYCKLGNLVNKHDENVYGLVVSVHFPSRTSKNTWRLAIHLIDETRPDPANPIEVCAFATADKVENFLPYMESLGTIVRFHRLQVTEFRKQMTARMTHTTTMSLTSATPGDREQVDVMLEAVSKTDMDWNRVEQLRSLAQRTVSQSTRPAFLYNQYLRTFTEVVNGTADGVIDLLVRTVTLPTLDPSDDGTYSFQVTDGVTQAKVMMQSDSGSPPRHYWELVTRFVGTEPGAWIKIRNCQVLKTERVILAYCGDGNMKPTTIFQIPSEFCQDTPQASQASVSSTPTPQPSRIVVSEVHASSRHLPFSTLAQVVTSTDNGPFRVMVRVVNTYPSEAEHFCQLKAGGTYAFQVALQLEDITGRVDAVVSGDDAKEFFKLEPTDLSVNQETLGTLESEIVALRDENSWLDCMLVPIVAPDGPIVYSITETGLATQKAVA
jgi:hypothetical protein